MSRYPSLIAAVAWLALVGGALGARAEVSAEVNHEGEYVRMVVITSASSSEIVRIWRVAPRGWRESRIPLNSDGDRRGDLWPYIVENPLDGKRPWAVWPRYNGIEFDLGWSRWADGGWTPIEWVEMEPTANGNDADPHLTLDPEGRPHLAWWRDENGVGRVYFSLFLSSRWMVPLSVSDVGEDSRYPTVTVEEDGTIRIDYLSPNGPESRIIIFYRPDTITDDLNPFDSMSVSEGPTETGTESVDRHP